ncbi:MAG TPA: glycosyltransferase family 9 protein [Jiangellales bacterium]|nr:glycosyltransferase family 9 protein [Jiangellales bacterium]
MTRALAVRLDSAGDVLLTGPAIRALAHRYERVDLLASPAGSAAGELLPGVYELFIFDPPWSGYEPPPVDSTAIKSVVHRLGRRRYDRAVIFTSYHQCPLPMALLARLAGVGWIGAISEDYPGSLLDHRHHRAGGHEVEAAVNLARAAGGELPPGDDGGLRLRRPLPDVGGLVPDRPYVALHPSASVPARGLLPGHARAIAGHLLANGWAVVITGTGPEAATAASVTPSGAVNLAGRTSLAELAAVLDGASCVVVGNTGPAHVAAAVGTPVVSLFAPVVPVERWAPYRVPSVVLGDQAAACRDTRARECPIPGHPCISNVRPEEVAAAVQRLTTAGRPAALAGAS